MTPSPLFHRDPGIWRRTLQLSLTTSLLVGCTRERAAPTTAIPHTLVGTETIRGGEQGAYRLRWHVGRYPGNQAEFDGLAAAMVDEFRTSTPACVVHLHVYGPGVYTNYVSDVGNATWGPPSGLGIADCRQNTTREFRRLEFLGTVPTITPTLRFGTARHAGQVPLPEGARRVRGLVRNVRAPGRQRGRPPVAVSH